MIDLTGLSPIADVVINLFTVKAKWTSAASITVQFSDTEKHERYINDLQPLGQIGCRVLIFKPGQSLDTTVYCNNYDLVAIAERIAMHYESLGLSVLRRIADELEGESVQSFVLL